jgi:membrane-bound ClpP family serine protease
VITLALAAQAVIAAPRTIPRVVVVNVTGVVNSVTAEILSGAIAQAKKQNAAFVFVRFITPGGPSDAVEKMIRTLQASPVPVTVDASSANLRSLFRAHGRTSIFTGVTKSELPLGEIEIYRPTVRQRILMAIADPNIALLLVAIGALCLYWEMNSPGTIVPGLAGAILVLLGLSSLSALPLNWLGVALLLLAFGWFGLAARFAARAILGAAGAISMVLGMIVLVDSPLPEMRVHGGMAISLALPFSAITVFLLSVAVRARRNKRETSRSAVTELAPEGYR